jgi:hypothetical protein
LEKRAEQVLPGNKRGKGRELGQRGEMSQTMYAHMNKWINKPKKGGERGRVVLKE